MNEMIGSESDGKNIGLLKNLSNLRDALDVYCVISANGKAVEKLSFGVFAGFVQGSSLKLIVLGICKLFEEERSHNGKARYSLDSIDGVLKALDRCKPTRLDSKRFEDFCQEYGDGNSDPALASISSVVGTFREKHRDSLRRLKTLRDKFIAHGESGFKPSTGPSFDVMEQLFDFGLDFYMLISDAFIGVGPCDLNRHNRNVKTSLKRVLAKLGCVEVKNDMD